MTATAVEAPEAQPAAAVEKPLSWKMPILLGSVGILSFIFFGLMTPGDGATTTFALSRSGDLFTIPPFDVPSQPVAIALTLAATALAALSAWGVRNRREFGVWLPSTFGLLVILAILVWAGAGKTSTSIQVTGQACFDRNSNAFRFRSKSVATRVLPIASKASLSQSIRR